MKELRDKLGNKEPFDIISDFIEKNKTKEAIEYIQKYCNCDNTTAKILFVDFKSDYDEIFSTPSNLSPQEQAYNNAVAQELLNKPHCPTCNSTNIQKIGAGERIGSVAMLGLFSKKINKSFKCKNCGYTW